jgi:hypothetical protein
MNQLNDSLRISKTPVVIQHVTIETITPYPVVKQRMQAEVKRLDDSYRQLLSHNELDAVRKKLEEGAQPNGLMLHYVGTHGDWLALKGGWRNGIQLEDA